jgi:hypothetical protein
MEHGPNPGKVDPVEIIVAEGARENPVKELLCRLVGYTTIYQRTTANTSAPVRNGAVADLSIENAGVDFDRGVWNWSGQDGRTAQPGCPAVRVLFCAESVAGSGDRPPITIASTERSGCGAKESARAAGTPSAAAVANEV